MGFWQPGKEAQDESPELQYFRSGELAFPG